MNSETPGGYAGALLRVDLSKGKFSQHKPDEATLRKYIGGTGIGAKYLYDMVKPGVEWSDPANVLVMATGPLGGTTVHGSGNFSVVTKGPMTNGAAASQANGFFGAFLKFCGYDGIVIEGAAKDWSYLYIHNWQAELRDARYLLGKDTWETEELIKQELGYSEHGMSVFGIGPAGENLVRFAAIVGDKGHCAPHNGTGAVMGSKKLKAVAVARGKNAVKVKDRERLTATSNELFEIIKKDPGWSMVYKWGMLWTTPGGHRTGGSLVKNYLTNQFPIDEESLNKFHADYIRAHYAPKRNPCWACQMNHCNIIKISEGSYTGYIGEEPEAEAVSSWSFLIGNPDAPSMIMLSNEVDRLGMDTNEASWVVAFVMECFEKGLLTSKDTDGLEMKWGNVEAARALLYKIARRQGIGDLLAEGVMRASQQIGADAPNMAIYTKSGNTPRSHDHRLRWLEMFDTSISNIGTMENDCIGGRLTLLGLPNELKNAAAIPLVPSYSPEDLPRFEARTKGNFQFLDSLGVCKFTNPIYPDYLIREIRAATGWEDFTWEEAVEMGLRTVNLLRAFNVLHGRKPDMEAPSPRYSSTPVDGPAKGISIAPVWDKMLDVFYKEIGWDKASGKPLPQTLKKLGLEYVSRDLWPELK